MENLIVFEDDDAKVSSKSNQIDKIESLIAFEEDDAKVSSKSNEIDEVENLIVFEEDDLDVSKSNEIDKMESLIAFDEDKCIRLSGENRIMKSQFVLEDVVKEHSFEDTLFDTSPAENFDLERVDSKLTIGSSSYLDPESKEQNSHPKTQNLDLFSNTKSIGGISRSLYKCISIIY